MEEIRLQHQIQLMSSEMDKLRRDNSTLISLLEREKNEADNLREHIKELIMLTVVKG